MMKVDEHKNYYCVISLSSRLSFYIFLLKNIAECAENSIETKIIFSLLDFFWGDGEYGEKALTGIMLHIS